MEFPFQIIMNLMKIFVKDANLETFLEALG